MTQRRTTLLVACLTLSCGLAWGQTATGSLSGTITDSNGASVPGARVVSTSTISGSKLEANVNPFFREPGHVEYAGKLGLGVFDDAKIKLKVIEL